MAVNQIYTVVNSAAKQAYGRSALTAINEQGLISLGNYVLSSAQSMNGFVNALVNQIGLNIFSYRQYRSKFSKLIKNNFEWGAIARKIKVKMPEAVADPAYDLQDGDSIDQYTIAKPKASQKLFYTETPWMLEMTFQRTQLKEAFSSEANMGSFISSVYGEIQNAIEVSYENLAKNAVNNFIAETAGTKRAINLLALYNAENGTALEAANALVDANFLRYAVATIKDYSDLLEAMTTQFNDGSETRHTPKPLQQFYVLSKFERRLETVVQYAAFKDDYVKLENYEVVPFWQSIATRDAISVNKRSDGTLTNVSNIMAVLFDTEALGVYKHDEEIASSPYNAKGLYFNTFWHFKDMYINDLSENFVYFYIAD